MAIPREDDVPIALLYARNAQAVGTDRYHASLVAALRTAGADVVEVPLQRREVKLGAWRVGGYASLWLQRAVRRVRGYDVVHALDPAAATPGCDVVTIHDLLNEQFPELFLADRRSRMDHRLLKRNASRARFLVCVSETTRQEVLARWKLPPERVVTVRLGVDGARFRPVDEPSRLVPEGAKPTLVYVGDDNPRKNILLAVEATARLRERHGVDARLLRIGPARFPSEHDRYRARAKELGVELVEPGYVDDEELRRVHSHAAAFVWPSLGEGWGFPPLEAMSCGLPVAALDLPINREVLGPLARLHANDAGDAADALAEVLARPPSREALRAYASTFTWERCARETMAVYERAMRR